MEKNDMEKNDLEKSDLGKNNLEKSNLGKNDLEKSDLGKNDGGGKGDDLSQALARACIFDDTETETVFSEDYSDDVAESGGHDKSESRLATFSLSMSDLDESTYASDDNRSRSSVSTLDLENEEEEEGEGGENDETNVRAWKRQRELRLSLILGISADEKFQNRLAAAEAARQVAGDDACDGTDDDDRRPAEKSPLATKEASSTAFHEDREFEFLRDARTRRCSSLKTEKTPPGTPHRKKVVRFADVLGLDLASVRHVIDMNEPPVVPSSAMSDLDLTDRQDADGDQIMVQVRHLCTCFSQPGCCPDFLRRVQERKVSLETCMVEDHSLSVSGIVRVANVAFQKQVVVRHTVNGWMTYTDDPATYVSGSNDSSTDRFSFAVHLPDYFSFGSRLEFSVMYVTGDQTFWDSNFGNNYRVECYFNMEPFELSRAQGAGRFY